MEPVLFSIIIPVYNVQDYLSKCVESVRKQTYPASRIEVLLIDDGSTDGSGTLAEALAAECSNITVFHKENGGLSDARNYGLERASGEYVIFLDSDDQLDTAACAEFAAAIAMEKIQPDVVAGTTIRCLNSSREQICRVTAGEPVMTGVDFLKKELQCGNFFVAAWASIYRLDFLRKNGLCFWKGILHEDEDFTHRVLLKASTVLSRDIPFYYYLIRNDSITTRKDKRRNAQSIFAISRSLADVFGNEEDLLLRELLLSHLAKIMFRTIYDARLHEWDKRYIIDYGILKRCCIKPKEKIRYWILRLSPHALYKLTNHWRR